MSSRSRLVLVLALYAAITACRRAPPRANNTSASGRPLPVATARRSVTDTYHGVRVADPYRWLENASDPAVRTWTAAQNRHTREALDRVPGRDGLERQLREILSAQATAYLTVQFRGGTYFVERRRAGAQQSYLVAMASPDDTAHERVIVDPSSIDPSGQTSIEWFAASHDGTKVAVALARGGSEVGTLHFFDVASAHEIGDTIERVNVPTGGGSAVWNAGGTGVYYTRYPRTGERSAADLDFYQQVYFHALGTPDREDRYEIGRDFPRIAEIALEASDDQQRVLATVANGDGGEFQHYVLGQDGQWTQLTHYADRITQAAFGVDGSIYLVSHRDASRGRIVRVAPGDTSIDAAREVVPQGEGVIEQIVPTESQLWVKYLLGGPSEVRVFDREGRPQGTVAVPPVSSVESMIRTTGDEVLYRAETYLTPPIWYRAGGGLAEPVRTALRDESPVQFDEAEVVQETATSRDGTHVPMFVIRRHGTVLDGSNPTLLTGYGGYGVSMTPTFNGPNHVWLERRGVIAFAALRGGGEFGEEWHHAGYLTHKQNVFDDFIACAERLIELHYTSPEHLAIRGRSNGGLLMGAAFTQHPELFRAVYSGVGIYDMLRVELDPNGAFNTTEFGTVRDPEQFRAMFAYSPYHHVREGVRYPAILMTTGENDGRVNPANSRKMIAALQYADAGGRPILLRTSQNAGHGMGSSRSEVIAEQVDVWSFLFDQLGMVGGTR